MPGSPCRTRMGGLGLTRRGGLGLTRRGGSAARQKTDGSGDEYSRSRGSPPRSQSAAAARDTCSRRPGPCSPRTACGPCDNLARGLQEGALWTRRHPPPMWWDSPRAGGGAARPRVAHHRAESCWERLGRLLVLPPRALVLQQAEPPVGAAICSTRQETARSSPPWLSTDCSSPSRARADSTPVYSREAITLAARAPFFTPPVTWR